jgi:outer membrane protein OmpA-like peptidoglycan-associated protein
MKTENKHPMIRASAILALAAAALTAAPRQVNINVQNGSANKSRKDSLAMADKAQRDSLALTSKAKQDSLAMAEKARRDSMAMSERARRDSALLGEANRKLSEERSKRSEMENQLLTTGLLVMDAVYFETGRTAISMNSKPYLNMLAKMLTKYPKLQIEVGGHTDNVGSDSYNQTLSDGRSAAVRNYLVSQAPELGTRLTSKGYGETMAKADNATAEGRKYNRRTELRVLNKEALQEYNEPARTSGTAPARNDGGVGGSNSGDAGTPDSLTPPDTQGSHGGSARPAY